MKKEIALAIIAFLFLNACQKMEDPDKLSNTVDSISYYTGVFTAWTVKDFDVKEFNTGAFRAGMEQVFDGEASTMSLADADFNIGWHFEKLRARQNQKNEIEGREFLRENKTKKGVQVTDSGLQYTTLKTGEGPRASLNDLVAVAYKGTLPDGTVFTEIPGDTIRINREQMIDGWIEALQLMNEGSKLKIFLAPELAFGNGEIPFLKPNMTVIYDLELIKILTARDK